jgi:hypothetical protein
MIELRTHSAIDEIGQAAWNAQADDETPPFLRYEFLHALEETGAVQPERGWAPMHVSLYRDEKLLGVAPAYVKGNSQGEFVFDHGIADFAQHRLGIAYFPKLIVASPFTPATGPRLLCANAADRPELSRALAAGTAKLVDRFELSGAHVLFSSREEAELLEAAGMFRRVGVQFHWHNQGYTCFDDFLSRMSSKRRHQLKRERRVMQEQGTRLEVRTGRDLDAPLVDHVFECYRSTVERYYWGRQYLSRDFFHAVVEKMPDSVLAIIARDVSSNKPVAAAFNLMSKRALFGRYWGAIDERDCLHFNVCYYEGIAESIKRGLARFEPGAGGEHKRARGFEPVRTFSSHSFLDQRLAAVALDFFKREAEAIDDSLRDHLPVVRPK